MVKGVKRLIPGLCCIVVLISCMVVPASALGPAVNPESIASKAYPFINGSMFYTVAENYDAETLYGSSYGLAQFIEPIYQGYFASDTHIMAQYHDDMEAGPEQWYLVQQCLLENDQTTSYKRLHEIWDVRDYSNVSEDFFTWSVTFTFDDFGGSWDRSLINRLFYLHGKYTFKTRCTVWTIKNGELIDDNFEFNGTANGAQSVLYGSWLAKIENDVGLSEGDPYMMSLSVVIPFGYQYQDLHISRLGDLCSTFYLEEYPGDPTAVTVIAPYHGPQDPVGIKGWYWFLRSNGLATGVGDSNVEVGSFTNFLGQAASSVFDAEIFPNFSLGGIFGILLAVSLVFWLMKLFGGG